MAAVRRGIEAACLSAVLSSAAGFDTSGAKPHTASIPLSVEYFIGLEALERLNRLPTSPPPHHRYHLPSQTQQWSEACQKHASCIPLALRISLETRGALRVVLDSAPPPPGDSRIQDFLLNDDAR
jgi:hypothetical protein